MDVESIWRWGLPIGVGAVVWAVRQEGRLNAHDSLHCQNAKRVAELQAELDKRHAEIREDIAYIRARIDAALKG